jgi:sporulation protein YlmC with PRC-barrel domain
MASLDDTTNPSGRLIAAKRVQNTTVYNTALEKLGTIEDVMIDKQTGRIAYAILAHGGFLGIGDQYYPLPWEKLQYNRE